MSQPTSSADEARHAQRRKPIQYQLLLLVHAHKCKDNENCRVMHCGVMKKVLKHMRTCKAGKDCKASHCSSSRQIIAHYANCNDPKCPICEPIRPRRQPNACPPAEQVALPPSSSAAALQKRVEELEMRVAELEPLATVEITDVESGQVTRVLRPATAAREAAKRQREAAPQIDQELLSHASDMKRVKLEKGLAETAAANALKDAVEARKDAEYEEEQHNTMIAWSTRQRAALERLEALAAQYGANRAEIAEAAKV